MASPEDPNDYPLSKMKIAHIHENRTHTCVYICMYIHRYVYTYIHVYIYIDVYVYIHIHEYTYVPRPARETRTMASMAAPTLASS